MFGTARRRGRRASKTRSTLESRAVVGTASNTTLREDNFHLKASKHTSPAGDWTLCNLS